MDSLKILPSWLCRDETPIKCNITWGHQYSPPAAWHPSRQGYPARAPWPEILRSQSILPFCCLSGTFLPTMGKDKIVWYFRITWNWCVTCFHDTFLRTNHFDLCPDQCHQLLSWNIYYSVLYFFEATLCLSGISQTEKKESCRLRLKGTVHITTSLKDNSTSWNKNQWTVYITKRQPAGTKTVSGVLWQN